MAPSGPYDQIQVNGASLAYRDMGRGEPLILVHGHISDIRSWEPIQAKLADRFRVIVYSRRYAWPNQEIGDQEGEDWLVHVDDLAAIIEKLNLGLAHVLGCSSGAYITILLAAKRPELVKMVLLEEPPAISVFLPRLPPGIWDVLSLLIWHPFAFLPVMSFGATVIAPVITAATKGNDDQVLGIFGPGALGRAVYDNLTPERRQQVQDNKKWLCNFWRYSQMPPLLEDEYRKIKAPLLMLTGARTIPSQRPIDSRVAALVPGGKEVIIPDAAHLIHEDNPDRVFEEVVAFVETVKGSN